MAAGRRAGSRGTTGSPGTGQRRTPCGAAETTRVGRSRAAAGVGGPRRSSSATWRGGSAVLRAGPSRRRR